MKIYKVVPSTSLRHRSVSLRHRSVSLRHRSSTRWLSVAETTIDEESAEILTTIKGLID